VFQYPPQPASPAAASLPLLPSPSPSAAAGRKPRSVGAAYTRGGRRRRTAPARGRGALLCPRSGPVLAWLVLALLPAVLALLKRRLLRAIPSKAAPAQGFPRYHVRLRFLERVATPRLEEPSCSACPPPPPVTLLALVIAYLTALSAIRGTALLGFLATRLSPIFPPSIALGVGLFLRFYTLGLWLASTGPSGSSVRLRGPSSLPARTSSCEDPRSGRSALSGEAQPCLGASRCGPACVTGAARAVAERHLCFRRRSPSVRELSSAAIPLTSILGLAVLIFDLNEIGDLAASRARP